eukprot:1339711-Pyramimonas_sp.AAC.1
MREASAVAVTPVLEELFAAQVSGVAPINGSRCLGGPGTAQQKAKERHKSAERDASRQQLDDYLTDALAP